MNQTPHTPGLLIPVLLVLSLACGAPSSESLPVVSHEQPREAVLDVESSFAATMADRDLAAFGSFLDEEAVFLTDSDALRGREEILAGWARYFETADAPFSWRPSRVEVLNSGRLALSTGPVLNPDGECVGVFTSVWRRGEDASWKIVFDRGSSSCDEP